MTAGRTRHQTNMVLDEQGPGGTWPDEQSRTNRAPDEQGTGRTGSDGQGPGRTGSVSQIPSQSFCILILSYIVQISTLHLYFSSLHLQQ